MKKRDIIKKFKHILNYYVEKYDIRNPKNGGRVNKYNNFFYINHILSYLFKNTSWDDVALTLDITGDTLRKKYNKWVDLNIFQYAYDDFLLKYRKHNCKILDELIIDATIIKNRCATDEMTGFCKKLPNKRSVKLTAICDSNKITMSYIFTYNTLFCNGITESSAHDSQHIDEAIDNLPDILTNSYTYNKPCIITGDKGYIINKQKKQLLRKI